jgi:hypothetical protein
MYLGPYIQQEKNSGKNINVVKLTAKFTRKKYPPESEQQYCCQREIQDGG